MSIYTNKILKTKLGLKINDINNCEIEQILEENLKDKIGNKCIKDGFVKKDSIKIIKRSLGQVAKTHFNGNIIFQVTYSAEICCPDNGSIIECKVKNKNKMGILAESLVFPSPLTILVANQHHIENEYYSSIKIGSIIFIEVMGKKYEMYDKKISIISKLTNKNKQMIANIKNNVSIKKKFVNDNLDNDLENDNLDNDNLDLDNDNLDNDNLDNDNLDTDGFPDDDISDEDIEDEME